MRVRSTSNMQCTWALVRRDSIMRWAMILRIWLMGTRSPGMATGAGVPASGLAEGTVAAGAAGAGAPSRNAVMSCLVMRPPNPVPGTCARSMLCSRAILRTSGEERAWSSSSREASGCETGATGFGSATGAAVRAGATSFFAGADGAAGAGLAAAPSPSEIVPTTVFTCTVAPSATLMSCRTPEAGAGISASTLSVEISNRGSSRCTLSPGFFSHLVMVPSKIDSPIWGMTISVGIIPFSIAAPFRARAILHYIYSAQRARLQHAAFLIVMPVLFPFGVNGGRRDPGGFFPIVLHGRRQFFDAREEGSDFPHVLVAQGLVPCGHTGVADTGADGVVDMPLGIIQGMNNQLGRRRVEGTIERTGFVVEASVTQGAVHGVDFHSIDQVFVSRGHGIGQARGMALHGGIHGGHGDAAFHLRRNGVGIRGQESKRGDGQPSQEE